MNAATRTQASDPALWTLAEAMTALAKKRVSSLELARACLARIERIAPKLNSFLIVEKDEAIKAAKRFRRCAEL